MQERFYSLATKYPLDVITHFLILIPLLVGLIRFSYLKKDMQLVMLFFLIDFGLETVALFSVITGHTTLFMPDIRASLNILVVAGIYKAALIRTNQKKFVAGIGVLFFFFSIVVYSGDSVGPWSQTAYRVYAMSATLAYYKAILSDLNLKKLQHHSMFWFTAGLLFYAGGTLFTTLFNQYLFDETTPDAIFDRYINLTQVLYIAFCLLATAGLWVSKEDRDNYFERDYFGDNFL